VRSKVASLGTMANWTFNFIVSLTFLLLSKSSAAAAPSGSMADRHRHADLLLKLVPETKASAWRTFRRISRNGWTAPSNLRSYPAQMRIDDLLTAKRPLFSVEFFPPKTAEGTEQLLATARSLGELEPDFVSVTYGAGGSTREGTVEITRALKDDLGLETMAHLSCVGETAEGLSATLDRIATAGIENVFALRGDPPRGQPDFVQLEGGLGSAAELAAFIGAGWDFTVGGACFPEVHPEAAGLDTDLDYLKTKVEAGASFLITQLFFDNQVYFDFVAAAREKGIDVPILAGVIPVASFAQTKRICELCDASIPPRLEAAFAAAGGDEEAEFELGVAYAAQQCAELLIAGVPGIHFYALNRAPATRAVLGALHASRPWERTRGRPADPVGESSH
jgi:methylenetetrahydrofolate reductase (NADPH)